MATTTPATTSSETGDGSVHPIPKPLSTFWHPDKTLKDILLTYVIGMVLPFGSVALVPPSKDSSETLECMEKVRTKFDKLGLMAFQSKSSGPFYLWAKTVGCAIVDYSYAVPRRPNVLAEWGFKSDQEVKQSEEDIAVSLYFPRSVLPLDVDNIPSEQNACGCIEVKKDASLDLSKTDTTVPIIINFHGGGMILGGALDSAGLGLVQKLAEIMPDKKPFIIASVDYRLAPEHPFPAAPMDALTIVDHFVKTFPSHKIHIMGISAGANVAAVATLEAVRKYPGRISSSLLCAPMLDPAANSLSYHLNSTSSHSCPIEFARWCWQAYLEMPATEKQTLNGSETLEQVLALNSNQTRWNESPWRNSLLERLINPTINLSAGSLTKQAAATTFIVQTNRGDLLRDEGEAFAKALLTAGANVTHIDANGSHFTGLTMDLPKEKLLLEAWLQGISM